MSGIAQYYRTLELENGASLEEVKQAYKDLAMVWHPDRFSNNARLQQKAQDKLKEINKAYEQLKSCQLNYHGRSYSPPPRQPQRSPQPNWGQGASKQTQQSSQRQDASKQTQQSNQRQGASKQAQQSSQRQGAPRQPQQGTQSGPKQGGSKQTQQGAQSESSKPGKRRQYNPIISLQEAKAILTEYKFKLIRQYPDRCICYESGPFCLDIREHIPEVVLSVPCDTVATFHRALLSIPCKSVGTFRQSEAQELINLFRSSISER